MVRSADGAESDEFPARESHDVGIRRRAFVACVPAIRAQIPPRRGRIRHADERLQRRHFADVRPESRFFRFRRLPGLEALAGALRRGRRADQPLVFHRIFPVFRRAVLLMGEVWETP